jgi:glycosyltransferase involved in cell wall biosynthesis
MRFSLIIPTYNRAGLVFKTVESALRQTFRDFEIIIVDDGSTDDTEARFKEFSHPQLTYVRKANAERGAARNFGARLAQGEYLSFFDSDDLMDAEHLAEADRCVEAFARPEVFAVGFRIEDGKGMVKHRIRDLPDPLNGTLLRSNVLGCNPVFVRKDIFAKHPFGEERALAGSEDWLLWLQLCARYPFRFWNTATCALVDHGGRSVYHFKEASLQGRTRAMCAGLEADAVFMKRYGGHLGRIRAFRHVYTGLHLALSGHVWLPLVYLGRASLTDPRSLARRATLGTLKHVLLNATSRLTKTPGRRA